MYQNFLGFKSAPCFYIVSCFLVFYVSLDYEFLFIWVLSVQIIQANNMFFQGRKICFCFCHTPTMCNSLRNTFKLIAQPGAS